jgi:hypothetical protein
MISPGMYNVTFSADSFVTKTVNNIKVTNYNASLLNVQLEPKLTSVESGSYFNINTYSLYQNYPNPFNPSTIISWQVPEKCRITIKLFDILGRNLAILLNQEVGPGEHKTEFDASKYNLSSGVYLIQMETYQQGTIKYREAKKINFLK